MWYAGSWGMPSEGLTVAVEKCLEMDRDTVERVSRRWSWEECWRIFRDNLIKAKN
jgi:hypothetical protein